MVIWQTGISTQYFPVMKLVIFPLGYAVFWPFRIYEGLAMRLIKDFKKNFFYFNLSTPGLSCSTWDLPYSTWAHSCSMRNLVS